MCDEETVEYTHLLRLLSGHMMSDDCRVVVTPSQFETLRKFLLAVEALGDGVNFNLELCESFMPGHGFMWDNTGTKEQDDAVESLISQLTEDFGWYERRK